MKLQRRDINQLYYVVLIFNLQKSFIFSQGSSSGPHKLWWRLRPKLVNMGWQRDEKGLFAFRIYKLSLLSDLSSTLTTFLPLLNLVITALDGYSDHLPFRSCQFHTPRCRKLKLWFHALLFILNMTR